MDVHRSIIEESSFIEKIEAVIRSQRVNAEWALKQVSTEYIERQAGAADTNLSEKHIDIADVADRLQRALIGSRTPSYRSEPGAIIIAESLRPSTVVELAKRSPAAIITDRAGWTSHTSILARELRLPMVSGINQLSGLVEPGEVLIVDAVDGEIVVSPVENTLRLFEAKKSAWQEPDVVEPDRHDLRTLDGAQVLIQANADTPKAYRHAYSLGARGVGLFRSESLINVPDLPPSEDDQLSAYIELAEAAGKDGLKIRTFDLERGDEGTADLPDRNPALGLRSIRLSLADEARFRAQLRAILRASLGRTVDIVLPMVSGLHEVRRSIKIIAEEKESLNEAGVEAGSPKIGAMIEVPSAVWTIREIAAETDFVCLGTNDLVQYILAVDRDNDAVADWYQTLHPAVISAISFVISAGNDEGKPVTVCGEMAGSPFYVPLLLGLGASELSMNVNSIHRVRRLVSGITLDECRSLVKAVKKLKTSEETEDFLREYYRTNWSDHFPPGLLEARHR
jgi:phosphotransferase system enzyme I (PtsI)